MHWIINITLLATATVLVAAESTDTKPKRDLSLITDILSGKIFEDPPAIPEKNVNVYQVKGLSGVVVKTVLRDKPDEKKEELPQANLKETSLNEDPRIALVSSYLGTKTLNETLVALENIKRLLESGVLHTQEEIRKVVPPFLFETTQRVPVTDELSVIPLPTVVPVRTNPTVCSCEPKKPDTKSDNKTEKKVSVNLTPGLTVLSTIKPVSEATQVHIEQQKVTLIPYKSNDDSTVTYYAQADSNKRRGGNVVVQQVREPLSLSPFFGSRIEDAAYRAYLTASDVNRNNPQYSSAYPFISQHEGRVYEPLNGGLVSLNNPGDYWTAPSHYSYTSVHRDGSQTSYTSSGSFNQKVENRPGSNLQVSSSHVNNVVFKDEKPQPLPDFFADRIQNASVTAHPIKFPTLLPAVNFVPSQQGQIKEPPTITGAPNTPSGFSYTVIHKDGTSTTYTDSKANIQNIANYFEQNKFDESKPVQNIVHVAGVKKPTPIPSVTANKDEKVESSVEIERPAPDAVQQTYVTPIPIYGTVHPVHTPLNTDNVAVDGQVSKDVPSQYSYTSIHKDGSQTAYTGFGLANENKKPNIFKEVNNAHENYHGSTHYNEKRFDQTYINKPSTATVVPIFKDNNNDETVATLRVLFPKPIVSDYTYKQINSKMPNKFVVVKVENSPNYDGFIKLKNYNVAHNADQNVQHNFEQNIKLNPEHNINGKPNYVYIPPNFDESLLKQFENKSTQTESGFTSETIDNSNFKIVNTRDEHHDSARTDSLNTNPIVVLPVEPTFSYTQQKIDGSSIDIVSDNNNNVLVNNKKATTESVHRGDIPDTVV